MLVRNVRLWRDFFDRAQVMTTTAGQNGWTAKLTLTAGTPTLATISGGGVQGACDATSEAQVVTLYQKDILPFPLAQIQSIDFILQVSGINAATTFLAGIATAENDAEASVAEFVFFKILGSSSLTNVVIDTKDGTTTTSNVATGVTLAAVPKKFTMDFTYGLSDVRFYIDGQRVAAGTVFNLSAMPSGQNVQPYVQIGKASGTGVPAFICSEVTVQYKTALGA